MKYIRLIIFLTIVWLILGCDKDNQIGIIKKSETIEVPLQELVKMRLSLAKIVSLAFINDEFRSYFKENFGSVSKDGQYYEECLLFKYQNDKVLNNGMTLKDFLNSIHDNEIKQIYGDNFIDQVLQKDRRVAIKLPDMFIDFNWEVNKIVPLVFATYPVRFIDEHYVGFHRGSHSGKYIVSKVPQVFHVNIKASEDYVILDEATLEDEFSNDILEFLPQLALCPYALNKIFDISPIIVRYFVIDLKSAFKIWQKECGYKGEYIDVEGCDKICQRECVEPATSICVLDHFYVDTYSIFLANFESFFRESFSLHNQFIEYQQQNNLINISIPNVRVSELGFKFSIEGIAADKECIPDLRIDLPNKNTEIKKIDIRYLITQTLDVDLGFISTFLNYGDMFYRREHLINSMPNKMNAQRMLWLIGTTIENCEPQVSEYNSGNFNWTFRY